MKVSHSVSDKMMSKVALDPIKSISLGISSGIYIGLGGTFYVAISALGNGATSYRFMGSISFCIGLILIIFTKTELFTGNNLMMLPWLNKKLKLVSGNPFVRAYTQYKP